MRKHYDFSNSRPNPYAQRLKKQITILIDRAAKAMGVEIYDGHQIAKWNKDDRLTDTERKQIRESLNK